MENPLSEQIRSLTDRIRQWYEQSPQAQHAYERLSADVDAIGAHVDALVNESEALKALRDRIAAAIDPSSAAPVSQAPEAEAPQSTVTGADDAPSQTRPPDSEAAPDR
jgi:hypothetical protein